MVRDEEKPPVIIPYQGISRVKIRQQALHFALGVIQVEVEDRVFLRSPMPGIDHQIAAILRDLAIETPLSLVRTGIDQSVR